MGLSISWLRIFATLCAETIGKREATTAAEYHCHTATADASVALPRHVKPFRIYFLQKARLSGFVFSKKTKTSFVYVTLVGCIS